MKDPMTARAAQRRARRAFGSQKNRNERKPRKRKLKGTHVMMHRQKEAWRKCLEGKIAQEQGREEDGLRAFAQALEIDPDNEHFRVAHEDARQNIRRKLSQREEDLLVQIQTSYAQLTPAGMSAGPGRLAGYTELLDELDDRVPNGHLRTYKRGLHS